MVSHSMLSQAKEDYVHVSLLSLPSSRASLRIPQFSSGRTGIPDRLYPMHLNLAENYFYFLSKNIDKVDSEIVRDFIDEDVLAI